MEGLKEFAGLLVANNIKSEEIIKLSEEMKAIEEDLAEMLNFWNDISGDEKTAEHAELLYFKKEAK